MVTDSLYWILDMKASYRIHADRGYVAITLEGTVTLPELGAHILTVWSDPAWNPAFNGLIDCSAAAVEISEAELQHLTKEMVKDPRCSLSKWALVVSTAADFGKFRKVDQAADVRSTIHIFFDRRLAEDWILRP